MFQPKFSFTNKIVKNLTYIAESRAFIINAPLVPEWEVSLRRDAILKSAHSSTAIEGNRLTLEEVSALANGREVMTRRKNRQEVLNYLEALDKISDFASHENFTLNDLLEIHHIVTKSTLNFPEDEGCFRNRQVHVVNMLGETIFIPPKTVEVLELIEDFLEWFNSPIMEDIDSVIAAGLTHYEMVRIHPFIDGNGRTARIMATLVLFRSGFDLKRFFALDDYYDHDRQAYYAALQTVDSEILDVTEWLEYFTDGVATSIKAVKEKVLGLSKDIKILKERGQIALNDRQMKIVEWIVNEGKITNRDIRNMFGISDNAALDEIRKLMNFDVIKREGEGRSVHYVLV